MVDAVMGSTGSLEGELADALTGLRRKNRDEMREEYDRAIDYLENRQRDDVEQELRDRFPSSMSGDKGQHIYPVTVCLTERYVSEAANAYNAPVVRTLVDENGKESEATKRETEALKRCDGEVAYDERCHVNEQVSVLLATSVLWLQAKRGNVVPVMCLPHDVYEVMPETNHQFDPTDPDDYAGFVVELRGEEQQVMTIAKPRSFAYVTKEYTTYFTGPTPWEPHKITGTYKNPFAWNQVEDTLTESGMVSTREREAPGLMLTFWHRRYPIGCAITRTDADIVQANRELNIAWSVLFDTLRFQGHSTPVLKTANKYAPEAQMRTGARFPAVLDLTESFEYANAQTSYTEQVDVIKAFSRLLAIAKRESPNDFSIDATAALSGFAKIVDSLPKLEARKERLRRLIHMEENVVWQRKRAILVRLGKLSSAALKMRLQVKFADVEFPETPDETAKKYETDIKYNLTTPAEIYAHKHGVSLEEAEAAIAKNKAANAAQVSVPADIGVAATEDTGDTEGADAPMHDAANIGTEAVAADVQQLALNGAQIAAVAGVIAQVAGKEIPRASGVELIAKALQIPTDQADKMLGDAGQGFEPAAKAPPAGFPPKPGQAPAGQEQQKPPPPKLGGLIGQRKGPPPPGVTGGR